MLGKELLPTSGIQKTHSFSKWHIMQFAIKEEHCMFYNIWRGPWKSLWSSKLLLQKNPPVFSFCCSGEFCFHYFWIKTGFPVVQLPYPASPSTYTGCLKCPSEHHLSSEKFVGKVNAIATTCIFTGYRQELSNKVCDFAHLALKTTVAEFYQ